jgi:cyclopropane fatty-acyl-phospholipid synthase-like methyltransferase
MVIRKCITNKEPTTWKTIWERKGNINSDNIDLEQMLAIDGFDTCTGQLSVGSWLSFSEQIRTRLGLKPGHKILEVGCGAGAFLLPFYNSGLSVYGIDYSDSLIKLSAQIMNPGVFKTSEANSIPFDQEYFDAVVSFGVFIYFRDLEYAAIVVKEMARVLKKNQQAAILDINDAAKKEKYELTRKKRLGDNEYYRLYGGDLQHQFYSKKWFSDIANKLDLRCEINDQNIERYENSRFRFNVFLEKKG